MNLTFRNKYAEFGRNMRSYFNLDVQSGKSKIVFKFW